MNPSLYCKPPKILSFLPRMHFIQPWKHLWSVQKDLFISYKYEFSIYDTAQLFCDKKSHSFPFIQNYLSSAPC